MKACTVELITIANLKEEKTVISICLAATIKFLSKMQNVFTLEAKFFFLLSKARFRKLPTEMFLSLPISLSTW